MRYRLSPPEPEISKGGVFVLVVVIAAVAAGIWRMVLR